MSTKYLDSNGLAYFWQKIKAYGNTHWGGGSSVEEIFIATIDETTYQEVADALAAGKIVFAITSNSYGTFNVYPYAYTGNGGIVFMRSHNGSVPQNKIVTLASDDTWTTVTENLMSADDVADYVAEQGTSGIWTYRKWNSGRTEAWCHYPITGSIAVTTASSAYGGYRSGTINLTIPSGIFTSTPTAIVQKANAQGAWLCYERVTSVTNIEIMLGSGTNQTLTNQYFSIYAWT